MDIDELISLIAQDAEMIEVKCPSCKDMTRVETLAGFDYLCLDCGTIFSTNE